jgi:hypothetical protein
MTRHVLGCIAGAFLFQGGLALGQNSLQTLDQELDEAKQQHQDVTTQTLTTFFTQVDAAMASPDAALTLYQQAGGTLPPPAPVVTDHENETQTEKDSRLAIDQANLTRLGVALQLHCGMLHYAALFVTKPDQKGLQDDWVSWLKSAAQTYPQIAATGDANAPSPTPHHRKKQGGGGGGQAPAQQAPFNPSDVKNSPMHDSIISKYLAFKLWGDKEQGEWSVADLPKLYQSNVLTPLRTPPTATTLAAWDTYIAMMSVDVTDNDQWNQSVYPPLQFERACDDYAVTPSTEKLEALVKLVHDNPTYPKVDDWISRVHKMIADYGASHGGAPAVVSNTPPPPPSDPNVNVTTVKQGDMTIITTHTNSAPATNVTPTH